MLLPCNHVRGGINKKQTCSCRPVRLRRRTAQEKGEVRCDPWRFRCWSARRRAVSYLTSCSLMGFGIANFLSAHCQLSSVWKWQEPLVVVEPRRPRRINVGTETTIKPVKSDYLFVQAKTVFVERWSLFAGSAHWSNAKLRGDWNEKKSWRP